MRVRRYLFCSLFFAVRPTMRRRQTLNATCAALPCIIGDRDDMPCPQAATRCRGTYIYRAV
jgi:hypothetical protein